MKQYFFVLGTHPALSCAEITAVLTRYQISFQKIFYSHDVIHLETDSELPNNFIKNLGGTIKIAEFIDLVSDEDIISLVSTNLLTNKDKLNFAFSVYGQKEKRSLGKIARQIKSILASKDKTSRYFFENKPLSAVQIKKLQLQEFVIVYEDNKIALGKTVSIFDFEDYNKRDYDRPKVDPRSGMLPPKVAQIMVNLATDNLQNEKAYLHDPFCGSGTIIQEGLLLGLKITGSDSDKEAVENSRENIRWLIKNYGLPLEKEVEELIFLCDAAHLSEKLPSASCDAIITEPYLGPVFDHAPTPGKLDRVILGLEKLYLGVLKDWQKVLKSNGKIVIVVPKFKYQGTKELNISSKLEQIGYHLVAQYEYARPDAHVIRQILCIDRL